MADELTFDTDVVGQTYFLGRPLARSDFVKVLHVGTGAMIVRLYEGRPPVRWSEPPSFPVLRVGDDESPSAVKSLLISEFLALEPVPLAITSGMTNGEMQAGGAALRVRGGELAPDVRRQLEDLPPSRHSAFEIRAAEATLANGEVLLRVAFIERSANSDLLAASREDVVEAGAVVSISASRLALPAAIASELYERPETSMGGQEFVLKMRDGAKIRFETGGIVDFPGFPEGYSGTDVEAVCAEGEVSSTSGEPQPSLAWCVY